MSEVKRIIALIGIPGDTSQCVRNESYLLRSRSLRSRAAQDAPLFNDFTLSGHFMYASINFSTTVPLRGILGLVVGWLHTWSPIPRPKLAKSSNSREPQI